MSAQSTESGLLRPTPPSLEFRCPDCPMCDKETYSDGDSFRCDNCGASWDQGGEDGEWDDPQEPGCASVIEWFNTDRLAPENETIRHETDRCILPGEHHGKHRALDGWQAWEDDDPRVLTRVTSPGVDQIGGAS